MTEHLDLALYALLHLATSREVTDSQAAQIMDEMVPLLRAWHREQGRDVVAKLRCIQGEQAPQPPTSLLCLGDLHLTTPLQVCRSATGYYLGVVTTQAIADQQGEDYLPGEPLSRDSEEYWATRGEATQALASGQWTQRLHA